MIYHPSPEDHPNPELSSVQAMPIGIDDRLDPIPKDKTRLLYGPELRLYFVNEQRRETIYGEDIIAGRDKTSCQLYLSSPTVARRHARFVLQDSTWYLTDTGSINGVLLNGCRLKVGKAYYLSYDDEIRLGDEKLIFYPHQYLIPPSPPLPVAPPSPPNPTPPPEPEPFLHPYTLYIPELSVCRLSGLILCYRNNTGVRTLFDNSDPLILHDTAGKTLTVHYGDVTSSGISVFLDQETCPRCHAVFSHEPNAWMLMDCGSLKGTRVNGGKLKAFTRYRLAKGDTIQFGNHIQYTFGNLILADQYQVIHELSSSPIAKTYLVNHLKLNKTFIAKVLDKATPSYMPLHGEAFRSYANLTRPLCHPMLQRTVNLIEDWRFIIDVKEFVQGQTLLQILETEGSLSVDSVVDICIQMCDVLSYLHGMTPPRIYRDIKPANIVRQSDGRLKLIDLELMVCCEPGQAQNALPIGSPGYAPPEQFQVPATLTPATDIYSLGVMLHQLLTGHEPTRPVHELTPIRQLNPAFPENLERIIQKCTQLDPQKRYQSCEDLLQDLNKVIHPDTSPKNKHPLHRFFHR